MPKNQPLRSLARFGAAAVVLVSATAARAQYEPPVGQPAGPAPQPPQPPPGTQPMPAYGVNPWGAPTGEGNATNDNSPLAKDGHPLAGWHNGVIYLRDANDNFRLYVQGRAQIDFYGFLGGGVPETSLKPNLFLRRIRPEITGEVLGHFQYMLAGDFGQTGVDNANGKSTETSAAGPGAAPSATSGRYASAQTPKISAAATDVFINYRHSSLANAQIGQFDANFTMENRTSDKYIQFMERSLAVRDVGIPTNKELGLMLWGETEDKLWFWSLGGYDGDGQNRPNVDSRFDVMARTFVHPFVALDKKSPLADTQIGGSFRYGSRDKSFVDYDYNGLSTQGQFTFWSPTYTGTNGVTHIIPAGDQIGAAGELRVPYGDHFDLQAELVYIHNGTREAIEGFQSTNSERFGDMHGVSYYAYLGFWPLGGRDINGKPGYENPTRVDFSKADPPEPKRALQLLVKWEQLALTYASASRSGAADAKGIDGDIKVNALGFGVNYWATKHIRLSLDYVYDMFPDSAPTSATNKADPNSPVQTSKQRAVAPGNTLGAGVDNGARDGAHDLHEVLARFAVAL